MANEGLTAQEILEYIGAKGESLEEFKTAFDSKYLTRENAANDDEIRSKLTGRVTGSITTHLKRQAKDAFGIEVSKDEIEGKKVEEIIDLVTGRAKETYEAKITDLNSKVESSPKIEEAVAEWETKYNKLKGEYSDTKDLLATTKSDFEAKESEWLTQQKTSTIDTQKKQLLGGLSFSDQVNDLTKTGFLTQMSSKYELDLSEDGSMQIKKDGSLIPSKDKHGEFMTPSQVYEMEAKENKLLKAPNSQENRTFVQTPPAVDTDGLPKKRQSKSQGRDLAF